MAGTGATCGLGPWCDGVVTSADTNYCLPTTSDPTADPTKPPGCPTLGGEMNHDGEVNLADIDAFVTLVIR